MRCLTLQEIFSLNDGNLSRTTVLGKVDTSADAVKRGIEKENESVSMLVSRNRLAAVGYVLWRGQASSLLSFDCRMALVTLSEIVNNGISGNGILRTWPIVGRQYGNENDIAPSEVSRALIELKIPPPSEIANESVEAKLSVVADLEWEIGIGPLHPFADGCGRTSRYFSSLLGLIYNVPAVIHSSREKYYSEGANGRKAFCAYYLELERVEIAID